MINLFLIFLKIKNILLKDIKISYYIIIKNNLYLKNELYKSCTHYFTLK